MLTVYVVWLIYFLSILITLHLLYDMLLFVFLELVSFFLLKSLQHILSKHVIVRLAKLLHDAYFPSLSVAVCYYFFWHEGFWMRQLDELPTFTCCHEDSILTALALHDIYCTLKLIAVMHIYFSYAWNLEGCSKSVQYNVLIMNEMSRELSWIELAFGLWED